MGCFLRILIPVDFSDCSTAAVTMGRALTDICGAELTALHVHPYDPPVGDAIAFGTLSPPLDEKTRAVLIDRLGALVTPGDIDGRRIELVVREGSAAEEILEYAGHGTDLIVMGTHGRRRALDRLFVGSVTGRVSRKAPCSVLTIRTDTSGIVRHPDLRKVLCPVDLTEASEGTVAMAASVTRAVGGHLTLFHAVDPRRWEHHPMPVPQGDERFRRFMVDTARDRLTALADRHAGGGLEVAAAVTLGRARDEILRRASHIGADLIVVGAHARSPLGGLLGSTPQHLMRMAPCPVLISRSPAPRASASAMPAESEART
jgi:nucleotide-binding universal stress UspA family protein